MSINFVSMKSICSWALKAQIPLKLLRPVESARFCSRTSAENIKQAEDTALNFEEHLKEQEISDESFSSITDESRKSQFKERSINEVRLLGRVGTDPEIKGVKKPYMTFKLATTLRVRDVDTGEFKNITNWHRIVSYNALKNDHIKMYVKKGKRVYVLGKLTYTMSNNDGGKLSNILVQDLICFQ